MRTADPYRLALLAPIVFVLHVVEEAPRFVEWFNALAKPPITESLFLSVNGVAFAITLVLALVTFASRETAAAVMTIAWLGFLMFANAVLHIVATLVHGYSPGTITATLLYLPFFFWFASSAVRRLRLHAGVVALVVLVASVPMAIHGYLIVFRGSRLF